MVSMRYVTTERIVVSYEQTIKY